ncbi:MAG: HAD family phosphatase, partial [Actinomycetales bacterium]
LHDTNYYIGYTAWLDIAPDGVSKASGLDVLCGRFGIDPADVLAVGDGNNDLEMLRWAGRTGRRAPRPWRRRRARCRATPCSRCSSSCRAGRARPRPWRSRRRRAREPGSPRAPQARR